MTFKPLPEGVSCGCQFYLTEPAPTDQFDINALELEDGGNDVAHIPVDSGEASVVEVGVKLANALATNGNVRSELDDTDNGGKSFYFEIDADYADRPAWESLYYKNRFLALGPRSSVGRMCGARDQQDLPERYITLNPFRVLAVLGVPNIASQEYEKIYDIFFPRKWAARLPLELKVLTSNEDLVADIEAHPMDGISAELIEDKWSVTNWIKDFRPKIIHISSDVTEGTSPCIRITKHQGNGISEALLEASELFNFGDVLQLVWLITLSGSADDGVIGADEERMKAHPMKGSTAIARSLVRHGFPASIGVRDGATWGNVNEFYRRFYDTTLRAIANIPPGGDGVQVDWANLLVEARKALHDDANTGSHWALPVIYCRPTAVTLARFNATDTPDNLAIAAEIRTLSRIVEHMNASKISERDTLIAPIVARIRELMQKLQQ